VEEIMAAAKAIGLTDDEQEKLKAQLLAEQERDFAARIAALSADAAEVK
jgi:hypothetical protein